MGNTLRPTTTKEVQSKTKNDEASGTIKQKRENQLPLSLEELENAEVIIRIVQKTAYRNEIAALTQPTKMTVNKSSPIYKLSPQIINSQVCVGGRLHHAPIADTAKHQVILPKKYYVANLIVRYYHELAGHSGVEHVLSLIREKYWIVKGRQLIRNLVNNCFDCKRR